MVRILALDSSIVVKWFKKGEEFEEEALRLRRDVLSSTTTVLTSELMPLEVCRAIVKVGYPSEKVEETYATLNEMEELQFIKPISIRILKDKAKGLIKELNLYVADALSLATALLNSTDLITEDRHLLKEEVKEIMEKKGLKITPLKEAYSEAHKRAV